MSKKKQICSIKKNHINEKETDLKTKFCMECKSWFCKECQKKHDQLYENHLLSDFILPNLHTKCEGRSCLKEPEYYIISETQIFKEILI